ncbi:MULTISPECIES: glycosyltransferase family 2 protein [Bifidobacterium]|jgi:cellulose synthase/poly-beta-1,6-N-acetylglucosamine synthase-like glycosyltransferase|uniref:Glycosyltransferase n=1 Tax=Bifidobacterium tibiigranuli TaxID=2172043 RepID=A0A5N6S0B6_9BIFI|nr:glycosyltransferase family 2 protein [Bifidobacterium tibiigranuli]KAE8127101.1 N-acetylglucosaminyltransferase [Bifidobacterium tibiigranuli]KAE8127825.1 glycosyltransferase [Bifidobacterium tibiigranuli]MCH3973841.1 glycosyltransferase family 2 protein [Bifidobacterium tibiigranuli]MCH4189379.1 glycosyltransferase family 2 protein [Bifidobacterium tibiigranuli]MCH4203836.1 glycosyltransferase family 2 protein [Bifidobacterium tibiigranuli]
MVLLSILDVLMLILGGASLVYQVVCILAGLFSKQIGFPAAPMDKRYAVLISARNEEGVIGNLIDSIRAQTYPSALVDIWLVADNCTDDTASVVRAKGCNVVERFNTEQIGKGYALTYLLDHMIDTGVAENYDAYFVFDADNLLDEHYIEEMNKAFHAGFRILTSYRNSVNLSDNWVSSGSALWFIRESRFLNNSRMVFGSSCHVGGTGFMFSREVMQRNKGWKFHLLTEDLEFTMDSVLHGDRIGYCGTAILYDEQPVDFAQSWRQRLRWSKGFLQVFRYYGPALIQRAVRERDFSAVDFTLLVCPFTVLSVARLLLGCLFAAFGFVTWTSQLSSLVSWVTGGMLGALGMMAIAALTILAERDHIGASNKELVAYVLSFPIYMFSYVPISFQAVFSKAEWKPIAHRGEENAAA